MGNEQLGERWFLMDHADNRRFLQEHDDGFRHSRDRRYALRLPGKTSFTEEFVRSKNCDDGFLALLRNDGDNLIGSSTCLPKQGWIAGPSLRHSSGVDAASPHIRSPL